MTETPKPTLLLAEDNNTLRDLLRLAFSQAGWQVTCARDGLEALELARRCQPQVMLLDILLSKISGLDILHRLKRQAEFERLPVIIMSELAFRETVEQAIAAGAQDFVVKPFDLQVLLDKAQKAIQPPLACAIQPPASPEPLSPIRPYRPPLYKKTVENLPTAG
jgi:DNA-binding response OmpR family regulator